MSGSRRPRKVRLAPCNSKIFATAASIIKTDQSTCIIGLTRRALPDAHRPPRSPPVRSEASQQPLILLPTEMRTDSTTTPGAFRGTDRRHGAGGEEWQLRQPHVTDGMRDVP